MDSGEYSGEFFKVRIFLTQNGFVAVLKKLSMTFVFTIEPAGVASKKSTHENGNGSRSGSQQQMCVVVEHCPGITIDTCLENQNGQTV